MKKQNVSRKIQIFVLLVICLTASGCRLFRFLEAKDQLGDFNENFNVSDHDGLSMVFKNPVLLAEDISWLMVYSPPVRSPQSSSDTEIWTYTLVKSYRGVKKEKENLDLDLKMRITHGKLSEIVFPKRITKYINRQVLTKAMGSVGGADVKKISKSATADVQTMTADEIPGILEVKEILGQPYSTSVDSRGEILTYRYRLKEKNPDERYVTFALILSFDEKTDELRKLVLPMRSVKLTFNFTAQEKNE